MVLHTAIFLKKIHVGTHRDPKFGWRGGGIRYINARKKVLERRSGLHPSEKELMEQHSVTKIPLVLHTDDFTVKNH
jgi:hypothetical protein